MKKLILTLFKFSKTLSNISKAPYRITMAKTQKLNLIEELTTHKTDFRRWPLRPIEAKTDFRAREGPAAPRHSPTVSQSPQSQEPSIHIPFDLYFKPKPIVGTDPRECFKIKEAPMSNICSENRQLSTILTPTLPLHLIEDENALKVILHYTYTGMHKILMEEAVLKYTENKQRVNSYHRNAPARVETEEIDLRYKSTLYPPLPPGWITAAMHWDCLQSRHLGDPFKTFWTRRGPEVECSCCCNPLPDMLPKETKEEIRKLIEENKLRLPYDVTKTGYGGYRPICAKGVSLEKKQQN